MNKYSRLQDKKWLEEQLSVKTMRQIAADVGSSYSAVQYMTVKHGLRVPKRRTYNVTVDKSAISKRAYLKKYPDGRLGEKAANWRGGKRDFKGYITIYSPDHPNNNQGYVFEHRLVAEQKLGRLLTKDEVVHHINGDKSDNRPENLEVCLRSEHVHHHFTSGKGIQALNTEINRIKSLLDKHNISY